MSPEITTLPGRAVARRPRPWHTRRVPYRAIIQGWHAFYVLAGTAAATLVGLLFVGLTLHLAVIVERPDVRTLARMTFASFGLALFLSLFVVIRQTASALGTELIIGGVVSVTTVVPSLVATVRSPTRTLTRYHLMLRFGLSSLACGGVILAGILIQAVDVTTGLWSLWIVTVVLLAVSLRNTWDLLVEVGMARSREADASSDLSEDAGSHEGGN